MNAQTLAPDWLREPPSADALEPALWPQTAVRGESGELVIGGVDVRALAAEFGTPLLIVDEADARSRATALREAFETAFAPLGAPVHIYYAGKAFLSAGFARWMAADGLRIDICTGGELAIALAAGINPALLGFHGNNKSDEELDRAIGAGIGVIVLDSAQEVDRVARIAASHHIRQRVRLRVNTGVHADTHEYLATAREDQKFGVSRADVPGIVAAIRAAGSLDFLGLHSHIGSQIFGTSGFEEAIRRMLQVHASLLADGPVPELNVGGGFGINYTTADHAPDIVEVAAVLARATAAECERLGIPVPVMAFEPGRVIAGPAGVTLYEVGVTKDVEVTAEHGAVAVRRYLAVDGGMSDNARPALYGADYTVRLAGRSSSAPSQLVRIVGKHCESGDIVVPADYLPADVTGGDLVAVAATGAYCHSLASNYNYLPRPAVVAVRDGSSTLLVRRETETDLLSRDAGLAAPTEGSR